MPPTATNSRPFSQKIAAATLALATLGVYAPGLWNGFVGLDDKPYISENPLVTQVGGFWRIWATTDAPQYYPLTFSTYWLEYRAWGDWPTGYLLTNVILHIANAWLVVALSRALGAGERSAWLIAAIFALHPANVASVAWLAERKNVLSGLFALLAALLYLRHARAPSRGAYALAFFSFALALLSKTAVLTLPLSLLLADAWILRTGWPLAVRRAAPFVGLSVLAAGVTVFVEHLAPVAAAPLSQRLLAAAAAVWFYLATLLAPARLSPVYPLWSVDYGEWWWWVALAGVLALAILTLRRRHAIGGKLGWGMGHFVALLAPTLGVISFGYLELSYVANHFLYLAAIGPIALLVTALQPFATTVLGRRVAMPIAMLSLTALGWLTARHVAVYRDEHTLFAHVLQHDPRSAIANQKLGFLALQEQRYAEAVARYATLVAVRPSASADRSDYAAALLHLGRSDDAIEQLRAAIALNARDGMAHMNLGVALEQRGDLPAAEQALRRGAELLPDAANVRLYLARFLTARDERDDAEQEFRACERIDPSGTDALVAFAEALIKWGRLDEARAQARKALENARIAGDSPTIKRLERWVRKIEQDP